MATLTFEGVEVQLSSKENINFSFQDNYLVLLCREFTGCIVLTPATDDGDDISKERPAEESLSPEQPHQQPQQQQLQRIAPPAVPASPRPGLLMSSQAPSEAGDEEDMSPSAAAAKRERIALLRKMVSSKGTGAGPSHRRSQSVDRVPRSPRPSSSPPDNRKSIFESGTVKKAPKEEETFSFKPTINAHSKEILATSDARDTRTPVYEALYNKKNDKERRRKRAVEEQLTKEMADCTFQPNVNRRIPSGGSKPREVYDDDQRSMVQRAESWQKRRERSLKSKREEAQKREDQTCTFKPATQTHGVDKTLLRSVPQNSPGYEEFVQRQVSARLAREELSKVPHVTGENWTGQKTKVQGFKFTHRSDRQELRGQIRSLKKPAGSSAPANADQNDEEGSGGYGSPSHHDQHVSSADGDGDGEGDEGNLQDDHADADAEWEDGNHHIPLHEIVAMPWYYVDKSKTQQGPMSVSALSKHWKDQLVNENSYVWTQGMANWVKAKDMQDLLLVLTHS